MTVDTLASLTPAALSSPKTGLQIPDEEVSTGLLGTKSESQHVELSVTVTADDCVNLEPAGKANEAAEKDVLEEKLQNLRFSPQILKNGLSMLGLNSEGQQTFLRMSLPNAGIGKVDFLADYKSLQILELSGNNLTDVSALQHLRYLTQLDLSNNKIADVLNISPAPYNLQEVDLSKNQIMQIGDLSSHRFLKKLCLDRNLIKSISGLGKCNFLTHLSLINNGISKIENLAGLPIKFLDLRRNRIKIIEGLETLHELEELKLGFNSIRSLRGLEGHEFLRILDLEANNIDDFDETVFIEDLPILQDLTLRKNPIANESDYRLQSIFRIQRISIFDGLRVPPEAKVQAINRYDPVLDVVEALQHSTILNRKIKEHAEIKATDLTRSKRLRPLVLCGPTGVGKRTLTARLLKEYPHIYGVSVSHTTRRPRPGEENGVHYHFVTRSEMEKMIEGDSFLEVVTLFGNTYGTSMESIDKVMEQGKVCIMDLEIEGVLALKRSQLNPRYIFVTVPNLDVLQQRLETRQKLIIQRRQGTLAPNDDVKSQIDVQEEILNWTSKVPMMEQLTASEPNFFDKTIVNDDPEQAYESLKNYVLSVYWENYDDDE